MTAGDGVGLDGAKMEDAATGTSSRARVEKEGCVLLETTVGPATLRSSITAMI